MSEALKKIREGRGLHKGPQGNFDGCSFANDYPLLFALLHDDRYEGKAINKGSLILVIEDGCWKAVVCDREMGVTAFVTGSTFSDLLGSVENGLGQGSLDWRGARASRNGTSRTR